ncbi:MAG: hypothetical protein CEN89_558 [Candidatus Berkelbacteria bacterium Licking1014_7]|uniref:Calcineurin-like phosphoesterase domain-containing protein n=1 Tax=Candidatus Berkelbacteria bacterium Licking1014_7 TaxID=2017147 RepID=A0A554LIF3_9BACT|nr:MAG: hypothetical protein CEN89_558 [Candidatus Berkelbacteria bacterium Licking1014_7]
MKILMVADLHGQKWILQKLQKHLEKNKYDAVFSLGDLCNSHDPYALVYTKDFIDLIKRKNHTPLFLIHGNQESGEVKTLFEKENVSVHLRERALGKYQVVGVGFGEEFPADPQFAAGKILLTHEPPRFAAIKQMRRVTNLAGAPLVHLSGHLHYIQRAEKIGKTLFVQCPTAQNSLITVLHLPGKKIEFEKLL